MSLSVPWPRRNPHDRLHQQIRYQAQSGQEPQGERRSGAPRPRRAGGELLLLHAGLCGVHQQAGDLRQRPGPHRQEEGLHLPALQQGPGLLHRDRRPLRPGQRAPAGVLQPGNRDI